MSERPMRRYRLVIDVQGDTPGDLIGLLNEIADLAGMRGQELGNMKFVSGGYSASATALGEERPAVTHESYHDAVIEWLTTARASTASAT